MLSSRNKQIFALVTVGIFLSGIFFGLLNVQWFATESIAAYYEMTDGSNEDGLNGGIWWSLLAVLLTSIALGPIAAALIIMTYRNKDVSDAWIGQIYGLLAGIPAALIWALLWLICLPFTWGLLPWGEWSLNWWKIFPFGFGLIWMGGLPLALVVIQFLARLGNPEYNHDLISADEDSEEDEDSSSITAEIAGIMPSIEEEKEPIEIIESNPGQPVRFRINNPPNSFLGDAWVGIYPASSGDQDHGDRWRWLRDIDVNNATLPGQSAGKWSIRVFKDGGYKLEHRVDFEIHSLPQQSSKPTSSNDIVEGKVTFKSVHGKYLSAQPDGRAEWNRDRADEWEYFHLEKRQGGKIALRGAHGMYVSAQPDGSVQINRKAAPPGGWEEFTVEHQFIQPVGRGGYNAVRLKSVHGKYLSAQSDGRVEWNRDHAPDGGWEDIEMEYQDRKTDTIGPAKKIQSALKQATEDKKTNFWDSVE